MGVGSGDPGQDVPDHLDALGMATEGWPEEDSALSPKARRVHGLGTREAAELG